MSAMNPVTALSAVLPERLAELQMSLSRVPWQPSGSPGAGPSPQADPPVHASQMQAPLPLPGQSVSTPSGITTDITAGSDNTAHSSSEFPMSLQQPLHRPGDEAGFEFKEGFAVWDHQVGELQMMSITAFPQFSDMSYEEMRLNYFHKPSLVSTTNSVASGSVPLAVNVASPNGSSERSGTISAAPFPPTPIKGGFDGAELKKWLSATAIPPNESPHQLGEHSALNPRATPDASAVGGSAIFDGVSIQNEAGLIVGNFQNIVMLEQHIPLSPEEMRMQHYRNTSRFSPPTFGAPTPAYMIAPTHDGNIPGYELLAKVTMVRDDEKETASTPINANVSRNGALDSKVNTSADPELVDRLQLLEETMSHLMSSGTNGL